MGRNKKKKKQQPMLGLFTLSVITAVLANPVCRPSRTRHFLGDPVQCDRFHMCEPDGTLSAEFLCQDGLVYDPSTKQCGLPFNIDCSTRPGLQDPQPVGRCHRLNGRWKVDGECDTFVDCAGGVERVVTCQKGKVYNDVTGECEYPDQANVPGCSVLDMYGYECNPAPWMRRDPDPTDCRNFFTCSIFLPGRLSQCPMGSVFNPTTSQCDPPEFVPGCEDYYNSP